MKKMTCKIECKYCKEKITEKDVIAINKKLLGTNIKDYMCLICLADYIGCTEDDLLIKIEELKEQGCTLFN